MGTKSAQTIDDTRHDRGVIFQEGTYIAVDEHEVSSTDDQSSEGNALLPQNRYYQLLLRRFDCLRTSLRAAAKSNRVITAAAADFFLPRSERAWTSTIHREAPNSTQVLLLDESAIYSGLQCCARSLEEAMSVSTVYSCWIWTLLALAGDTGTLSHEKIGRIREIGQKIGRLGARLRKDQSTVQQMDKDISMMQDDVADADSASEAEMSISGDEGAGQASADVSDLDRARACLLDQLGDRLVTAQVPPTKTSSVLRRRKALDLVAENEQVSQESDTKRVSTQSDLLLAQKEQGRHGEDDEHMLEIGSASRCPADLALGEEEIDMNTRAAIDMVLTVVAEYFGQRDLLIYRQPW